MTKTQAEPVSTMTKTSTTRDGDRRPHVLVDDRHRIEFVAAASSAMRPFNCPALRFGRTRCQNHAFIRPREAQKAVEGKQSREFTERLEIVPAEPSHFARSAATVGATSTRQSCAGQGAPSACTSPQKAVKCSQGRNGKHCRQGWLTAPCSQRSLERTARNSSSPRRWCCSAFVCLALVLWIVRSRLFLALHSWRRRNRTPRLAVLDAAADRHAPPPRAGAPRRRGTPRHDRRPDRHRHRIRASSRLPQKRRAGPHRPVPEVAGRRADPCARRRCRRPPAAGNAVLSAPAAARTPAAMPNAVPLPPHRASRPWSKVLLFRRRRPAHPVRAAPSAVAGVQPCHRRQRRAAERRAWRISWSRTASASCQPPPRRRQQAARPHRSRQRPAISRAEARPSAADNPAWSANRNPRSRNGEQRRRGGAARTGRPADRQPHAAAMAGDRPSAAKPTPWSRWSTHCSTRLRRRRSTSGRNRANRFPCRRRPRRIAGSSPMCWQVEVPRRWQERRIGQKSTASRKRPAGFLLVHAMSRSPKTPGIGHVRCSILDAASCGPPQTRRKRSLVAIHLFPTLMTLLRLDRQRGDRAGVETLEADRLAGFLAITVGAFVEALERRIDLGDQLALAVASAKFDGTVGFRGCPVRKVRMVGAFLCQMIEGFARFA